MVSMLKKATPLRVVLPLAAMLLPLGGCYMEVHDAGDDGKTTTATSDAPFGLTDAHQCDDATRAQLSSRGQGVGMGHAALDEQCYQTPDYTWRTSCKEASCQSVKVFTHYMLNDDLGSGHPVHVEAFDNPNFQGAPAASVTLTHFDAKMGEWKDADLYLQPGEYYLRAYMSTSDDDSVQPYVFGGMQLVKGGPVGVYGALSGAEMVRVAPREQDPYPPPVHIYLDRQFKEPGTEPDTNAHIRLSLTLADGLTAPDAREVKIRLQRSADLNQTPVAEFSMPSALFLVQGRVGHADYLTPSLDEGDYVVFVYLDANGNNLVDDGEWSAINKQNGQPFAVHIVKDRTEPVALTLTAPAVSAPATGAGTAAGTGSGAASGTGSAAVATTP